MSFQMTQNTLITPEMMYAFAMLQSHSFGLDFSSLMQLASLSGQVNDVHFPISHDINQSRKVLGMEALTDCKEKSPKEQSEQALQNFDYISNSGKSIQNCKPQKTARAQKSNRNISSNILKHFLVYIKNRQLVAPVCEKLAKAVGIQMSYQSFMDIVKFKFRKIHNYIRPSFFRELCFGVNCDANFSKILRILFRRFIKQQFGLKIQHATKVGRAVKYQEIRGARKLLVDILSKDN